MKRILKRTIALSLPALALLSLHLLMPPDIDAQVRSRRSVSLRPHRAKINRTRNRDAVFIGGGASTGAIVAARKRRNSIIAGGAGVGARTRRRSSNITGGALGAGVSGRTRRINSAIGAGGAGTYRKARRNRGRGRN